ncbi:hypothetical protein LC593_02345 [Nostoc sp. CHAB 5844]|nr:hypothetical protein [Nostoc sp. CHAB 5844]
MIKNREILAVSLAIKKYSHKNYTRSFLIFNSDRSPTKAKSGVLVEERSHN